MERWASHPRLRVLQAIADFAAHQPRCSCCDGREADWGGKAHHLEEESMYHAMIIDSSQSSIAAFHSAHQNTELQLTCPRVISLEPPRISHPTPLDAPLNNPQFRT